MHRKGEFAIRYLILVTTIVAVAAISGMVPAAAQKAFPSPAAAVKALQGALEAKDAAALRAIFGPQMDALRYADPNDDVLVMESFAKAIGQMCNPVFRTGDIAVLHVGAENYPFPIPLVYNNGCWRFDTAAGLEEILARRIGASELAAIETCQTYRLAQMEYAQADCSGGGKCAYAQRFTSDMSARKGLDLQSAITVVSVTSDVTPTSTYPVSTAGDTFSDQGYVFKILRGQGPAAAGGRRSYVVDGDMVGGFALAAYPVWYGVSGLTSFLLGPDGRVYERCLGAATPRWGATVTEFNPEAGWKMVEE